MTHGPVQEKYRRQMASLAAELDRRLNGYGDAPKKVGFALLVYEFGAPVAGRINYMGNGARDDVKVALRELLAQWEGMAHPTGHG